MLSIALHVTSDPGQRHDQNMELKIENLVRVQNLNSRLLFVTAREKVDGFVKKKEVNWFFMTLRKKVSVSFL